MNNEKIDPVMRYKASLEKEKEQFLITASKYLSPYTDIVTFDSIITDYTISITSIPALMNALIDVKVKLYQKVLESQNEAD